jgi:hypothetical protein
VKKLLLVLAVVASAAFAGCGYADPVLWDYYYVKGDATTDAVQPDGWDAPAGDALPGE